MFRAAFVEVDITPPPGITKIGFLKEVVSTHVIDPLFARIAIFANKNNRIAFIQLDTLSIRWTQTDDIRQRIENTCGFPGSHIMVSATHNHAGPAVSNCGVCKRDEAYIESMVARVVPAFAEALKTLEPAVVGFNRVFNFDIAHNRRVVMRDGTARTHGSFDDRDSLRMEGPIDPELATISVRDTDGRLRGVIVNYACHPTHHLSTGELSAGYPGVLAAEMKRYGCPVALFLNGACGNLHFTDPVTGSNPTKEAIGQRLASDVRAALEHSEPIAQPELAASAVTVELPYRDPTDDEIHATVTGAQRFVDPALYDKTMPSVVARIRERGSQPAEVQVLSIGNISIVGIPAEYFVEHGLRIKEETWPHQTLVASCTNGMVGYVPTKEAFTRGGYETTFAGSSRLAPDAGDILTDAAIEVVRTSSSTG